MAKSPRSSIFEIGPSHIRTGWAGRGVSVAFRREDDGATFVIDLDSIEEWETGEAIEMAELQRLLELIERECDRFGVEVEFE